MLLGVGGPFFWTIVFLAVVFLVGRFVVNRASREARRAKSDWPE